MSKAMANVTSGRSPASKINAYTYFSVENVSTYFFNAFIEHEPVSKSLVIFSCLFIFRYARLLVNIVSYLLYRPRPIPRKPSYSVNDVTVIIPTTDPYSNTFTEALQFVLDNHPAAVIVALAGRCGDWKPLANCFCYRGVSVVRVDTPNKRRQICAAVSKVN